MSKSRPQKREKFLEKVRDWPTQPGVYIMYDEGERIIYVGKAKNLRNRIKSYFQPPKSLPRKTRTMVGKINRFEFTITNTELEALLLECNLIKKHRPRYNVRLKDDKNFPYFVLDFTHPFPQFLITRKVKQSPNVKYFGPFSGGVNEISRFLLKTFKIRDCSDSKFKNRTRPCLNYEIQTCTAPCVQYVSEDVYSQQVNEAILFLKGKKRELLTQFKSEMNTHSKEQEYELAKVARDKIYALEKITAKQDAILTEKQKNIDVIGAFQSEDEVQWVVLFIRMGALNGRKAYKTKLGVQTFEEAFGQFLQQFYTFSLIPDEVWVSSEFDDRKHLEEILSSQAEKKMQIRVRRSESSMRLLGMAFENAKLLYMESKKKDISTKAAEELQSILNLKEPPLKVECMDVSNLKDESPIVSLVHFEDAVPRKSRYRLFNPKTVDGQNDFAMIHEAVSRRFSKADDLWPDLLVIDGGKGQLSAAVDALKKLSVVIPICSLAKSKTQSAFTLKTVEKSQERIFIPGRKNPVILKEGNPALRLLQNARDEAHRFAITNHRKKRSKKSLESSEFTDIPGIGPKTREKLLKSFPNKSAIASATIESLIDAGLSKSQASKILKTFKG